MGSVGRRAVGVLLHHPALMNGSRKWARWDHAEGAWEVVSLHDIGVPSIRTMRRSAAANIRGGLEHPIGHA